MPRTARKAPGGMVFHVLNRGVGRAEIFHKPEDYAAFERVLAHALSEIPLRLFCYCLMPNHWHLILSPPGDKDLGRFMHRLTMTHTLAIGMQSGFFRTFDDSRRLEPVTTR